MDTVLTQEDIDIFGSDPVTIKEQPGTTDYSNGVEVRYTAPGKWWNWFWNIITSWFTHHKSDTQALITEQANLLATAGYSPDANNTHQVAESYSKIAFTHAEDYDEETVVEGGVERPVNKPYVAGAVIVLPASELL